MSLRGLRRLNKFCPPLRATNRRWCQTPVVPFPAAAAATPTVMSPSSKDVATPQPLNAEMARCPIMGRVPASSCPVETEEYVAHPGWKVVVNQLGKSRLSAFVTSTATVGYIMSGGTVPCVAVLLTAGTYLQSLSANTANQCIEVEQDRLMKRTEKRPLVRGYITKPQAVALLTAELAIGTGLIYTVSPVAAALGCLNWFLYVCTYTPLKRISTTNTWWGAIVGAIPPLMGGAAAGASLLDWGAMGPSVLLGSVMFLWQIPHFMSLAFHCRRDYEAAGFKMLPFHHPTRASVYSVITALMLAGATIIGPIYCSVAMEPWYIVLSTAANAMMVYKAVNFHIDPVRHCRSCFVASYMYLAVMLALLAVNHFRPVRTIERLVFPKDTHRVDGTIDAYTPGPNASN